MSQKHYYTDEKNAQIVIALLKAHGIRKVIVNPGATNTAIVDCLYHGVLSPDGNENVAFGWRV